MTWQAIKSMARVPLTMPLSLWQDIQGEGDAESCLLQTRCGPARPGIWSTHTHKGCEEENATAFNVTGGKENHSTYVAWKEIFSFALCQCGTFSFNLMVDCSGCSASPDVCWCLPVTDKRSYYRLSHAVHTCGDLLIPAVGMKSLWSLTRRLPCIKKCKGEMTFSNRAAAVPRSRTALRSSFRSVNKNRPLAAHQQQRFDYMQRNTRTKGVQAVPALNATQCKQPCISCKCNCSMKTRTTILMFSREYKWKPVLHVCINVKEKPF